MTPTPGTPAPAPGKETNERVAVLVVAAMCITATLMLAASAEMVLVPVVLVALLAGHMIAGVPRMPEPRAFFTLLLAVPFALWWRSGEPEGMNAFVPVAVLYVVGMYMMALATHHVLASRSGGKMDYALACAIMSVGLSGVAARNAFYLPLLAMFIVLLLVYLRCRIVDGKPLRQWRLPGGRLIAAVALVLALAFIVQVFAIERIDQMNRWVVQSLLQAGDGMEAGFDRNASLNSITRIWNQGNDEEVALRVFAERLDTPYFRGAAYDRYGGGTWRLMDETAPITPRGTEFGRELFNIVPTAPGKASGLVYSAGDFTNAYFVPSGVHQISSFADRTYFGAAWTFRPDGHGAAGGYGWYEPRAPMPQPGWRDLSVPDSIEDELTWMAAQIMGDGTPAQQIDRLQRYFAENFEYQLGLRLTGTADPIIQFLRDIRKGHCEYFASAGVLLLRSRDIPARYVTGFVCDERGMGDMWIARRKNAHAWIEAYLPDQGWTTVEVTPPAARPAPVAAGAMQRFSEWIGALWQRTVGMLFSGGLGAFIDWLVGLPARAPLWVWAILITLGMGWVFRAELVGLIRPQWRWSDVPHIRRLQLQLREAERMLARHGLPRHPSTTVGQYLRLLDAAPKVPQTVRGRARQLLESYQRERFSNGHGGA